MLSNFDMLGNFWKILNPNNHKSMNAILTTIGSRGDIQPYIALGTELQKHFETVSIVTHPWAAPVISQYGLNHIPAGPDIDIHYEARQFVAHSKSKMEGMKYALNFIFDNLHKCHKDFLKAAKNADVVIGHGIAGQLEALVPQQKHYVPEYHPFPSPILWISNNGQNRFQGWALPQNQSI